VTARGRDFQRAARLVLAADVAHVRAAGRHLVEVGRRGARQLGLPTQPGADLGQAFGQEDVALADQRRFGGVGHRDDDSPAATPGAYQRGQDAGHGAQFARERQFAEKFAVVETFARHLGAGGEDAQGDGEIEAAAVLRQLRRREVHGDAPVRVVEGGALDGHAHAVARLAHGRFGQADDGGGWQAAGQVDLDDDLRRGDTFLRTREGDGEAHGAGNRNR